jgi:NAD(P)-dependent dehydrogenase (short-subunit alcohol dehydrogenase family)
MTNGNTHSQTAATPSPSIAFITGSSSGVGEASALRLMDRGVKVFGFDVSPASERLSANPAYRHFQGDAGNLDLWDQALSDAKYAFGGVPSAVVFCAARLIIGSTVTLDEADWKAIFETNVFGPARVMKRVIPLMTLHGGGSIVFINSSDGLVAEQNLAAYCASKGAGLQLMRAVAIDHARQGVRANAICPGSIETPFFMRHVHAAPDPEAFLAAKTGRHPLGRLMQPVDIAALVDFLCSKESAGITGTAIPVDGGLVAAFDFYPDQAAKERAFALTQSKQ